jgi:hypothetical protein
MAARKATTKKKATGGAVLKRGKGGTMAKIKRGATKKVPRKKVGSGSS